MEEGFTKDYTQFVKGIAAIMLCVHHLFWHSVNIPVQVLSELKFQDAIIPITKTCVALFTLLSGYGIGESSKNKEVDFNFQYRHIKKLLINYWWIYVPTFVLSFFIHIDGSPIEIYSSYQCHTVIYFLMDFTGTRAFLYGPTLNNTWWYMEAVICYYALFPAVKVMIKKIPAIMLFLSAAPVVAYIVFGVPEWLISTDRELFYLLPFALGVYLSDRDCLNKLVSINASSPFLFFLSSLALMAVGMLLTLKVEIIGNVILSLAVICTSISIKGCLRSTPVLSRIGKNSMNIFLIHSLIYYYYAPCASLIAKIINPIVKTAALVLSSWALSEIVELSKRITGRVKTV